jgi:hypothetical protein
MTPTIRVDSEVWNWLKQHADPLEDTPNSVLRKLAGLDPTKGGEVVEDSAEHGTRAKSMVARGEKTPQGDFRAPILQILKRHGGSANRTTVLKDLESLLGNQLTEFDKSDIKSGTIRWQKSAEWEVRVLREQGVLEPVNRSGRGEWKLSAKGANAARS